MQTLDFELDRDFVELNQLLKLVGLCDSGGAGIDTGGPPALHARDVQAFANALDRWLAKNPLHAA